MSRQKKQRTKKRALKRQRSTGWPALTLKAAQVVIWAARCAHSRTTAVALMASKGSAHRILIAAQRKKAATVTSPYVSCLSCAKFLPPRANTQRIRGKCSWWGQRYVSEYACSQWQGAAADVMEDRAAKWGALHDWVDAQRNKFRY